MSWFDITEPGKNEYNKCICGKCECSCCHNCFLTEKCDCGKCSVISCLTKWRKKQADIRRDNNAKLTKSPTEERVEKKSVQYEIDRHKYELDRQKFKDEQAHFMLDKHKRSLFHVSEKKRLE
jgi:hypothetical protein